MNEVKIRVCDFQNYIGVLVTVPGASNYFSIPRNSMNTNQVIDMTNAKFNCGIQCVAEGVHDGFIDRAQLAEVIDWLTCLKLMGQINQ